MRQVLILLLTLAGPLNAEIVLKDLAVTEDGVLAPDRVLSPGDVRRRPPEPDNRIEPGDLQYEGTFSVPPGSAQGDFSFSLNAMSFVPDCMGRVDPTPDDGYPGCLLMTSDLNRKVGLVDIPGPDGSASLVVDHWKVVGVMPERRPYIPSNWKIQGLLYDLREDGTCRIWWHAMSDYGGYTQYNWPTLGMSSCGSGWPRARGLWHVGPTTDDPTQSVYHSNKIMGTLRLAPKDFADRNLKGKRLVSGWSKDAGTRGGSPGPSLFFLSEEDPTAAPNRDIKQAGQMLWYRWRGTWDFSPKDFPEYRPVNRWSSWEWLTDAKGNQAVIFFWSEAVATPEQYPYSDDPVWWYGRNQCDGSGDSHEPSFPEIYSNGDRPPPDCSLVDECEHSQGWHALRKEFQILFYDPEELGQVARGKRRPWSVLPYARIKAPGWFRPPCRYGGPAGKSRANPEGSAFDDANRLLYFAQGGQDPVVHVLRLQ